MDNQMQSRDDRPVGESYAEQSYETPTLTKLGTVKQLTQNDPGPDDDGETTDFIVVVS